MEATISTTHPPTMYEKIMGWLAPLAIGVIIGIASTYMVFKVDVELLKAQVVVLNHKAEVTDSKVDLLSTRIYELSNQLGKHNEKDSR